MRWIFLLFLLLAYQPIGHAEEQMSFFLFGEDEFTQIKFNGARKGDVLKISNLDITNVQAYLTLDKAVDFTGDGIVIKGIDTGSSSSSLESTIKIVDAIKISLDDNLLIIERLPAYGKNVIIPGIKSIFCFAAIGTDKNISYLFNAKSNNSEDIYLKGKTEAIPFGFDKLIFDSLQNITFDEIRFDNEKLPEAIALMSGKISRSPLRPNLVLIRQPENKVPEKPDEDDLSDELKDNMEGFNSINKDSISFPKNTNANDILTSLSKRYGIFLQKSFWGYAFLIQNPEHAGYRILKKSSNKYLVYSIANPGFIAYIPAGSVKTSSDATSKKTGIQEDKVNMSSIKPARYMGFMRDEAFLKRLYDCFINAETNSKDIDGNAIDGIIKSRSSFSADDNYHEDPFNQTDKKHSKSKDMMSGDKPVNTDENKFKSLVVKRKSLDRQYETFIPNYNQPDFDEFARGISKNSDLKLQMICPLCRGSGVFGKKLCKSCKGLGRLSPEETLKNAEKK